ncbi:MAG: hypothetical protein RL648_1738 [Verrucomicrobiota bacterium]
MPPTSPLLLIISGPAGSGKTTLCDRLLETFPDRIQRVITTTSRPPRPGEINGIHYHFLSPDDFRDKLAAGAFIEHASVHGRFYGTQRQDILDGLGGHKDLLLNIDVQGAQAFKADLTLQALLPRLHSVFIKPQSLDQIKQRLRHRATDDTREIERRLQSATAEIACAESFDHCIVSHSKDEDFASLRRLYLHLSQP